MKKSDRLPSPRHAALVAGVLLAVAAGLPALAAPTTPAAPAAKVVPGGEIAFDDLPNHVGATIVVSTTYGTHRTAVLTGASSIAINLKLVAAEGGFALSMPRESVAKVVLATAAND